MSASPKHPDPGIEPADPVRRQEPDLDPGLEPDPHHEVTEDPPERVGQVLGTVRR